LLKEEQKKELIETISKYMLENQVKELREDNRDIIDYYN